MDTVNIVLCGLGGQGILFMTRVIAQAALHKGLNIMGAETHGMAQRGGSVVSHLRLGQAHGSLVRTGSAHFLLGLDEDEAYRNLPFLARGASMYVNAEPINFPRQEVKDFLAKKNLAYHAIPAANIAMGLGAPLSSNLALLGYFTAFDEGPVSKEEFVATIGGLSPERYRAKNLEIFEAGLNRGLEERGV